MTGKGYQSMSSNKTTHLQLSQWVPSDPVLRADFNTDNSRLDAAVNNRSLVRMAGGTLSTSQSTITTILEDVELSQFRELQILCGPVVAAGSYGGSAAGPVLRLALNNGNRIMLPRLTAAESTRQGIAIHLMLTPAGPCGYAISTGGTIIGLNVTDTLDYKEVPTVTLSLSDNASFGAGTWYGVYGIKM